MKKIIIQSILLVLILTTAAWAEVQVVINRQSTDNPYWQECAKVMGQIIKADDEESDYIIRRSDFFQVEISADIHSDGKNISTIVKIFRRGEEVYELVFKPVLFVGHNSAVQNGETMGRSVKRRLGELERICRLSYKQLE